MVLALSTAARAGELWNLTWQDVDLKDGRLLFRITKNATPRMAWLHAEARRLLAEHGTVRRLGNNWVFVSPTGRRYRYEKVFRAACAAAGIEGFRFHDLRHSAATYLAREACQRAATEGHWRLEVWRCEPLRTPCRHGNPGHRAEDEREDSREVGLRQITPPELARGRAPGSAAGSTTMRRPTRRKRIVQAALVPMSIAASASHGSVLG